jgi:hypothetical protein
MGMGGCVGQGVRGGGSSTRPDIDGVVELKMGGGILRWRRHVVADSDRGGFLQPKEEENKVMR